MVHSRKNVFFLNSGGKSLRQVGGRRRRSRRNARGKGRRSVHRKRRTRRPCDGGRGRSWRIVRYGGTPRTEIIKSLQLRIDDLQSLLNNTQYSVIYNLVESTKTYITQAKNTLQSFVDNPHLLNTTSTYCKLDGMNSYLRNYMMTMMRSIRNVSSDVNIAKHAFLKECQSIGQKVGSIQMAVNRYQNQKNEQVTPIAPEDTSSQQTTRSSRKWFTCKSRLHLFSPPCFGTRLHSCGR